jgi:hypothetical protein
MQENYGRVSDAGIGILGRAAPIASDERDLPVALNVLRSRVESLEGTIGVLLTRLEPITLSRPIEQGSTQKDNRSTPIGTTHISDAIYSSTYSLELLERRIQTQLNDMQM